jgi:hypothetical protein
VNNDPQGGFEQHDVGPPVDLSPLADRRHDDPFVAAIEQFAQNQGLDLITFPRHRRKDEIAREYVAKFRGPEGILFVGKAQERAAVVRTISQKNPRTGRSYPWLEKSTAMVNHYYFYGIDEDFGPFFIKFCSYFPCNAKLCLNGHEYVKRQLTKEGIALPPDAGDADRRTRHLASKSRLRHVQRQGGTH